MTVVVLAEAAAGNGGHWWVGLGWVGSVGSLAKGRGLGETHRGTSSYDALPHAKRFVRTGQIHYICCKVDCRWIYPGVERYCDY